MHTLTQNLTLPIISYFNGSKFTSTIRDIFGKIYVCVCMYVYVCVCMYVCLLYVYAGKTHIEDLWLPFFCVSTNIKDSEMLVHTRVCVCMYVCMYVRGCVFVCV